MASLPNIMLEGNHTFSGENYVKVAYVGYIQVQVIG